VESDVKNFTHGKDGKSGKMGTLVIKIQCMWIRQHVTKIVYFLIQKQL